MTMLLITVLCIIILILCHDITKFRLRKHRKKEKKHKDKKLCSKCMVGEKNYELDPHSEACIYISAYENGKCPYYKPIEPK